MKSKIIRDVIHGDIYFPEKFIKLVDTPEFQRLHRIKQLGTAYMLFPSAVHTRFSHSIGTYHIMGKLIDHFEEILNGMGKKITDEEKDLALCAALLHDIGHGPFSHAFEKAFPKDIQIGRHEEWTVKIITSESTMINKVLRKEFGEKFPEMISWIIEDNFDKMEKELSLEQTNIFKIISLLISSHLDADRMDYLLRDAYFTSVTNGEYDLDRLIKALDIDSIDNKICVCVNEKYISTLEQYVLARYHMNKEVYLHPIKCEMESIVKKILYRLYELATDEQIEFINILPEPLIRIFKKQNLSENDYIDLDDSKIISLINDASKGSDYILTTLCNAFLNRVKYKKLNLFNNQKKDVEYFKTKLSEIISSKYSNIDYDNEYFWIECNTYIEIYKIKKDIEKNILIRKSNGTLVNIINASNIINKYNAVFEDKNNEENKENQKTMAFINEELFNNKYEGMLERYKGLVKSFDNRKHIEIEKKYLVEDCNIFDKILNAIENFDSNYEIESITENPICQVDYYYDTKDKSLYQSDKTLRIREIKNQNIITIKRPVEYVDKSNSQRFEFEEETANNSIEDNKDFILEYLPELGEHVNDTDLINLLIIKNQRQKFMIRKSEVLLEMSFDHVKFSNDIKGNNFFKEDWEIEIELKSDYSHRVCLDELTTYIENILHINPSNISKYKRGMNFIESSLNKA